MASRAEYLSIFISREAREGAKFAKIQRLPDGHLSTGTPCKFERWEFESASRKFAQPLRVLRSFASFA
jgi:hypothetical protein